jgi:hydrogenase nickel incorporation protein HypA/HybF
MHEAGVTERILEVVIEHATEANAKHVTDVHLEIGEESGVDAEAVATHWEILSKGTLAEDAELHFEEASTPFTFQLTSIEIDDPD